LLAKVLDLDKTHRQLLDAQVVPGNTEIVGDDHPGDGIALRAPAKLDRTRRMVDMLPCLFTADGDGKHVLDPGLAR
jgi:hypothetical protein